MKRRQQTHRVHVGGAGGLEKEPRDGGRCSCLCESLPLTGGGPGRALAASMSHGAAGRRKTLSHIERKLSVHFSES